MAEKHWLVLSKGQIGALLKSQCSEDARSYFILSWNALDAREHNSRPPQKKNIKARENTQQALFSSATSKGQTLSD